MKVGFRTPNLEKSLKARTTGRLKRSVKRAIIPGYGKKGMGWITDPKKAAYNKIYSKTTVGVNDIMPSSQSHTTRGTFYFDKTIFLCTIFGGWFGLHKYIKGNIKMGIIYTLTAGLFLLGWLFDIAVEATRPRL